MFNLKKLGQIETEEIIPTTTENANIPTLFRLLRTKSITKEKDPALFEETIAKFLEPLTNAAARMLWWLDQKGIINIGEDVLPKLDLMEKTELHEERLGFNLSKQRIAKQRNNLLAFLREEVQKKTKKAEYK